MFLCIMGLIFLFLLYWWKLDKSLLICIVILMIIWGESGFVFKLIFFRFLLGVCFIIKMDCLCICWYLINCGINLWLMWESIKVFFFSLFCICCGNVICENLNICDLLFGVFFVNVKLKVFFFKSFILL